MSNTKIKDAFGKYCGVFHIEVDGIDMDLKPNLKHKRKLLYIQQKVETGKFEEDDLNVQMEVLRDILKISYPELTPEEVTNFLIQNDVNFLMEVYAAFGWRTKKEIEDFRKQFDLKKKS